MKNVTKILLALAVLFILGGIMVSCDQGLTIDSLFKLSSGTNSSGSHSENTYKITFEANGGDGTMSEQYLPLDEEVELNENKFTKEGYLFKGWTTASNGENVALYADKAKVKFTTHTTLYAQWKQDVKGFSVSDEKVVQFAKGNLYYNSAQDSYSFENNQYDFRTRAGFNACINGAYSVDSTPEDNVGLFFWSSKKETAVAGEYYDPEASNEDSFFIKDLPLDGEVWNVLSYNEWKYLLEERTDASEKNGIATIVLSDETTVTGIVFLPDSFTLPNECEFISGTTDKGYEANTYNLEEWDKMEAAGAVFLPASGWLLSGRVNFVFGMALYWASSPSLSGNTNSATLLYTTVEFGSVSLQVSRGGDRSAGRSIRLVREI